MILQCARQAPCYLKEKSTCVSFFVLLLACANGYTQTQITAEVLVNRAYADGGLIATANLCQIDKAQINQLIFNQKKAALETAKIHQLQFLAKDYDDYVISGFESTMRMLNEQAEDNDTLAAICSEVQEKISKKIAP
jgi:hypothetical protein